MIAFLGIIVLGLLINTVGSIFFGWILMILVGVIHHEWLPQLPTIGYWWAVVIALLIRIFLMETTSESK